jgi:transposase-like protein
MVQNEVKRKYTSLEQCRAVLLVWTERKSARDICRAMGVHTGVFTQWQDRAMDGLLSALEPREGREPEAKGPAIAVRVKTLMDRKMEEREGKAPRLQRRLQQVEAGTSKEA